MKLVPLITPRTHLIFRDHEIAAQRSPPVHPGVWALSGLHTISCVSTYSRLILLTITIQSNDICFRQTPKYQKPSSLRAASSISTASHWMHTKVTKMAKMEG